MVKNRLILEPEVQAIFKLIDEKKNFLLSGGAGSGKTYSLVEVIKQVLIENPTSKIACMTYTNAAVTEISSRINNKRLHVGTLHEFLWDLIRPFKKELTNTLITLLEREHGNTIKKPDDSFNPKSLIGKEIQYREYVLMREGIISHDELLILSNCMFSTYPKLCNIAQDRYKFIFIDEYQDTSKSVIEIFLEHFSQGIKNSTIGFFGDSMQSIYDDGIGDLNKYLALKSVHEVKKTQNRRNPRLVYELANKLRTDGIKQIASTDNSAPNMKNGKVIDGDIKFFYSSDSTDKAQKVKSSLGWDFNDTKENKELNLTHNLIAPKAGFAELMSIYDGDKILEYRDRIKKFIETNKVTEDFSHSTFGDVIEKLKTMFPNCNKKIMPTITMQTFIDKNTSLYHHALSEQFENFRRIYVSKDSLIDDKKDTSNATIKSNSKRDSLIKHLFKIQSIINLYEEKKYNEFLKKTEFKIRSIEDKKKLKYIIDELRNSSNLDIGYIIEKANELGVCKKDDNLNRFISKNKYIYDRVKHVKYEEFQNLYNYLEGKTPFSTQHKIKGVEFNNVLVVLDNGSWNKYNFNYLFENEGTPSVVERTKKLFYVCCTRSKNSLVIYYKDPSPKALQKAEEWFGANSIECIQ